MFPWLQSRSQLRGPFPARRTPLLVGTEWAETGSSGSPHQQQKPGKGERGADRELDSGGIFSTSSQRDGVSVKQPVAPPSAHGSQARASPAPVAGQVAQIRGHGHQPGHPGQRQPAQGPSSLLLGCQVQGGSAAMAPRRKMPSNRQRCKQSLKEIIKRCLMAGDRSPVPRRGDAPRHGSIPALAQATAQGLGTHFGDGCAETGP